MISWGHFVPQKLSQNSLLLSQFLYVIFIVIKNLYPDRAGEVKLEKMIKEASFGSWLKKRRKALDLTREEFAQKAGCSASALRKIESDERRPSKQLAELLANVLEIPIEERERFIRTARRDLSFERIKPTHPFPRVNQLPQAQTFSPHIPIPSSPLIGRETELSTLLQMLEDTQCRLVTITGMGGIGKTRLAIETASAAKDNFADGVGFIELAGLNSPDFLVSVIANALSLNLAGSQDPQKQLLNTLRDKELLLVLDNAEILLPDVGLFVEMINSAPFLKLLVTSRERLNTQWEWVFEIQGLPVPLVEDIENMDQSNSVALFIQRARQVKTDLKFDSNESASVVRICQMVEGNPLAIELAAPWVKVLSIGEIRKEIQRHLDILESSMHDIPERHRSIRTTFNYSWNLLSEDEKHALSSLSTFRDSFTREAAEKVTGTSLTLLSMLKTKSWLNRSNSGRFYLHELVRQYAAEKLQVDPGEERQTQMNFGDFYAINMKKWDDEIKSPHSIDVLAEMRKEIDNIRQAWEWMILHGQQANISRSHFSLYWYLEMHGLYQQGITLFDHAADMLRFKGKSHQREQEFERLIALGQVLSLEARWLARSGDLEGSSKLLQESIDILRSIQDKATLGDALRLSGNIEFIKGNYASAAKLLQESVTLCREASHRWGLTSSLIVQGNLLQFQGEYEQSLQAFSEAVSVARVVGEPRMLASSLFYQADVIQSRGLFDDAEELLKESLAISQSIQDRWSTACALQILGTIATKKNETENAVERLRSSLQIFTEMGERARIISSRIDLGNALLLGGSPRDAKFHFIETIKMAAENQLLPAIVEAVIGVASILAQEKETDIAYELAYYVLNHPSTNPLIKEQADQLRADLEAQISQRRMEEIRVSTQNKTVEDITRVVLESFEIKAGPG